MEPIVIYGAGGFARELLQLLVDVNCERRTWEVVGFLADSEGERGTQVHGLPILGGCDVLERDPGRYHVAIGVGSPQLRRRMVASADAFARSFPTLIHPSVQIGRDASVGPGAVITAGNILTVDVQLGEHTLVNLACTIGHDSVLGRYSTLSPGANISGRVVIGEGCDIGTGSAVVQGVTIGEWSIVGAGAVVAKDLPANCTAVGAPAKPIKERPAGWHLT